VLHPFEPEDAFRLEMINDLGTLIQIAFHVAGVVFTRLEPKQPLRQAQPIRCRVPREERVSKG
jgi:hypothetical protein